MAMAHPELFKEFDVIVQIGETGDSFFERCSKLRHQAHEEKETFHRMAKWLANHRETFDAAAFASEFGLTPACVLPEDQPGLTPEELDSRILNSLWCLELCGFIERILSRVQDIHQVHNRYIKALGDYPKIRAYATQKALDLGVSEVVINMWLKNFPPWPFQAYLTH